MASGFEFPHRLGFGCSGAIAQPWFSARKAHRVLLAALEGGVRHFDTAPFYADGEGERRLAAAIADFGAPVFISTKTGTRYRRGRAAAKDFSDAAIRADVETSLRRLKRDRIDLVYLHGPSTEDERRGLDALLRLKTEGKIGLVGICGEGLGVLRAAGNPAVDVVMGAYNFLRRGHGAAFAAAKARGAGVVAIAPLAQGLYDPALFRPKDLAGAWRLARAFGRNRAELAALKRYRPALSGGEAARLALAFVHAHPAIDVALTTTTRPAHLAETLSAAQAPTDAAFAKQLARLDALGAGA